MKRWILPVIAVLIVAVAVALVTRRDGENYNVMLVSIDTLRPDHLGCYGYENSETPNIDRLAEEGYLFREVIATVPLTLPSHASLLTGLSPIKTGVRDNGAFVLSQQFTTLAEALREHGYSTGGFVGSYVLDSDFGLDQGFDVYDDEMELDSDAGPFYWPEKRAGTVNDVAKKWFAEVEEPFFAFIHYYDPHLPYDPPPPYDAAYADRPYDGEIAYTDKILGELLDTVRERGLFHNTLIVLVSDHGEAFGEHDERGHGVLIYEPTMKVALIVKPPESFDPTAWLDLPGTVTQLVQLTDVLPTIMDFLGFEHGQEVDGKSLLPLLRGERLPSRILYFESLYPHFNFHWSALRGVRHNEWKYILAPEEELYNVAEDPNETRNLYLPERERAEQLKEHVKEIAAAEGAAMEAAQRAMTQDDVRKLMTLGYLAGGQPTLPEDIEPEGKDPKHLIAALTKLLWGGRGDVDKGDFEVAAAKFTEFVDLDPMNPQAHIHLAKALVGLGRMDEARAEYMKAVEIDTAHSGAFFPVANLARMRGDVDMALFYLSMGAEVAPETPEVEANIGGLLVEKGLPDSAIAVLRKALERDQHDPVALLNMGLAYMAKGRQHDAEKWFRATLEADPGSVKALANMANIFIGRGDMDSTVAYLERAHDIDPADAVILANLGNAYLQKRMLERAGEAFEKAISIDAENLMALYGLAAVLSQEGNKEESISLLRKILEIDPGYEPAQRTLRILSGQQ